MRLHRLFLLAAAVATPPTISAQTVDNRTNSGTPQNGLFHGGEVDSVQLSNGNLHIEIPLYTVAGRGLPYRSFYVLDTKQWYEKLVVDGGTGDSHYNITPELNGTFPGKFKTNFGYIISSNHAPGTQACLQASGWSYNAVIREPNGTKHHLVPDVGPSNPQCQLPTAFYSDDGSGFAETTGVLAKDGTSIAFPMTDTNGNQITQSSPPTGPYVDTLGRQFPWPGTYQYFDSAGTQQTIQFTAVSVPMHTNLCQWVDDGLPCNEYTANMNLVSQITLPNGAKYAFTYVQNDAGEPSSVTLPSGATISWTYGLSDKGGMVVTSRTVVANGQSNTWTYNYTGAPGTTGGWAASSLIDPLANETDFTWQAFYANYGGAPGLPYLTTKKLYDKSSGTPVLVKTEQTDYSSSVGPVLPIRVTTTWNQTNQVSKVETDYDSFTGLPGTLGLTFSAGNPTSKREYDWGPGAPGNLLRRTILSYLHLSNSTYLNANIVDRVTSKTVYDSLNTTCKGLAQPCAQTTYSYDSTAITSTSGAPNHDYTHYGSTFTTRGNLTVTCRLLIPGNSCLNTTNAYDDLGNLRSTTDPAGNTTSFSYTDNFTDGVNRNAQAFVTQTTYPVTNSVNHIEKKQYFFYSSLVAASCGQNFSAACVNSLSPPQPDYAKFTYDNMFRPLIVTRGDGGSTTYSYNDTVLPLSATSSTAINGSFNETITTLFEDLNRVKQTQLTSDPQGTIFTDKTYDALGRVATVSNPYRTGNDITTSAGTTTYFYDALGRKCLEVPPDGTLPAAGVSCPATQPANDLITVYSGNTTTVTDQTGKSRMSVTNGLGQLVQVFEDPGTSPHLNYETDYAYDALGNLLCAGQKGTNSGTFTNCASIPAGWRARIFTYDSISRLLTSNNPEVGTITYRYDSDTNCSGLNSFPGLLVSKTDARSIRTCYQFDALNRETVRNYSNNDPTVTTAYDQPNCLSLSSCINIGHRTSMTDAAGSEAWAYQIDTTNHPTAPNVHQERRTNASVVNGTPTNIIKTATYYLDLAGNINQIVYPTGRIVNYSYDRADRPSTAVDGSNGITYATGFKASPGATCLANVTCYTPQGTFYALSIGQSTAFTNGLNLTHIYNSRLQPQEFRASAASTVMDISYSFVDPVSGHNAGHVYRVTNNIDGTRSQTFSYDQLNHITAAQTTSTYSTSPVHCWGETYQYDGIANGAWGNLTQIAATTNPAYTGCTQESGFTNTVDGNNHLSGFGYDSSGNTTGDGVNTYTWDAESQLRVTAGSTYIYDGDGRRVAKANTAVPPVPYKLYWYGSGDEILAETDGAGNTNNSSFNEYIFFGGQRIAMITNNGNPTYYVEDLLGTSRVLTTNTGVTCYDADFYPFGVERQPYVNTCSQNNYKFEGKERDTETLNDDFGARYYSNRFGRWLSADWSAVPAPVPYANLTNPQTLNLYAMVADDPESFADLDGHGYASNPNWDGEVQFYVFFPDQIWMAAMLSNLTPAEMDALAKAQQQQSQTTPQANTSAQAAQKQAPQNQNPINVSVSVIQEPQMMQDVHLGNNYVTGVGAKLEIGFSDSNGKPLAGASVTERNSPAGLENPGAITTNAKGTIQDYVIRGKSASEPNALGKAGLTMEGLKNAATSTPIKMVTTQTLTITAGKKSYQATYTRTLTNVGADGKLSTNFNSHGVNFAISFTKPVITTTQ